MLLPNISPHQVLAIDIETCDPALKLKGPGWINHDVLGGFICGLCIATDKAEYYIPVRHGQGFNFNEVEVWQWFTKLVSDERYPKIMHNAHYDLGWLTEVYNIPIRGRVIDTMFAAALLDEQRFSYSLDSLAKDYLGVTKDESSMMNAIASQFKVAIDKDKTKVHLKHNSLSAKKVIMLANYEKDKDTKYKDFTVVKTEELVETVYKDLPKQERKGKLWALDYRDVEAYGKQDARITFDLWKLFEPKITAEKLNLIFDLELDLIPCHIKMRRKGIRIDVAKIDDIKKQFSAKRKKHIDTMAALSGIKFTENDLAKANLLAKACDKLGVGYSLTATEKPCFSKKKLMKGANEFIDSLLEARKYDKVIRTYIEGYIEGYTINGRIHPQFNQLQSDEGGTVTGRYSCSNPNLQNIPSNDAEISKAMRSLFIPDKGEKLLVLDYSQQEPRMLVHLAIAYHCKERPINGIEIATSETFSGYDVKFHDTVAEIAGVTRQEAKAIGLGIMYGRGIPSIVSGMREKGSNITIEEATAIKQKVINAIPFLADVDARAKEEANNLGFVRTILGRKRRYNKWTVTQFPDDANMLKERVEHMFNSKKEALEFKAKSAVTGLSKPGVYKAYTALNAKIQGSSADQTKAAIRCLWNRYLKGECALPQLTVHDEVVMSVPADADASYYRNIMENCVKLRCLVKASGDIGDNWKEAK